MAEVSLVVEQDGGARVVAVCATPAGAELFVERRAADPLSTAAWSVQTLPVLEDWEAEQETGHGS